MLHEIEIQTERLFLKSITPAFIKQLFKTKTQEEIVQMLGVDEAGYERYKSMYDQGAESFRISLFFFLLRNRKTGLPIGECGFHSWNKIHRKAELFYLLRNDSDKQKGFMSEALPVVLDFGFKELGLHRIAALLADWNTPSVKLVQRYGFTKEGTLREDYMVNGKAENSHCYSLLKWEWEKR